MISIAFAAVEQIDHSSTSLYRLIRLQGKVPVSDYSGGPHGAALWLRKTAGVPWNGYIEMLCARGICFLQEQTFGRVVICMKIGVSRSHRTQDLFSIEVWTSTQDVVMPIGR